MTSEEFKKMRNRLGKTQKQMSYLLGVSLKAVHSYEQGWRAIPAAVERQVLFLVTRLARSRKKRQPCWKLLDCPLETRNRCPAWEFQAGDLCWFVSGTHCHGENQKSWADKIKICRSCKVLRSQIT